MQIQMEMYMKNMCIYVSMYIHTCVDVCIHVGIYEYSSTELYWYSYVCMYASYIHTHTYMQYVYIHKQTNTISIYIYMYTYLVLWRLVSALTFFKKDLNYGPYFEGG